MRTDKYRRRRPHNSDGSGGTILLRFQSLCVIAAILYCLLDVFIAETNNFSSRSSTTDELGEVTVVSQHRPFNHRIHPQAWIVQADSSPLSNSTFRFNLTSSDWMDIMAVTNLAYARHHQYGYTRFTMDNDCQHTMYGHRHIAWCKLLAIFQVLSTVPDTVQYVVWMDSDAVLQLHSRTLLDMIDTIPTGCMNQKCRSKTCHNHRQNAALITAANIPFCGEPALTAFLVWKTKRDYYSPILTDWWNANQCATEFPWEQRALNNEVYDRYALQNPGGIAILAVDVNRNEDKTKKDLESQYIRHIGHSDKPGARQRHALAVAELVGLDQGDRYEKLHKILLRDHIQHLSKSDLAQLARDLSQEGAEQPSTKCDFNPRRPLIPE